MMRAGALEHHPEWVHRGHRENHAVPGWVRARPRSSGFGAYIQDLPNDLLALIGHEFNVVFVQQVVKRTPAANPGLLANDVLLALQDVRVVSAMDFVTRLRHHAGKAVTLSVLRQGERLDVALTPAVLSDAVRPRVVPDINGAGQPWLVAQPADWSRFGNIRTIDAVSARTYQFMEQQWQVDYDRTREQIRRNLSHLQPGWGPITRYGPVSRQAGGLLSAAPSYPTCDEVAKDRKWFSEGMERYWTNRGKVQKNPMVEVWADNCPNIYSQLFAFPRPRGSLGGQLRD
jgi:PDZ domain